MTFKQWYNVYIDRNRYNPKPFNSVEEAQKWIDEKFKYKKYRHICEVRPVQIAIMMMEKRCNEIE